LQLSSAEARSEDDFSLADTEKRKVFVHVIKTCRGVGAWVQSLLNVELDRVNGQIYAPAALPPGKEPVVLIEKESKWAAGLVWKLWEYRKLSSAFLQFNKESLVVQSVTWSLPAPTLTETIKFNVDSCVTQCLSIQNTRGRGHKYQA
jgi:hypothetical protein